MINPSRVHRARGTITAIRPCHFEPGHEITINVRGHDLMGWVNASKLQVGQEVNIQASFSITLDRYCIKTVRAVKGLKVAS